MDKLKTYQVGENDIVCAFDETEALAVFDKEVGVDVFDGDKPDVFEVPMSTKLYDEDGSYLKTLGELMLSIDEPQYLFGWE